MRGVISIAIVVQIDHERAPQPNCVARYAPSKGARSR
jgi:hypothetical protein